MLCAQVYAFEPATCAAGRFISVDADGAACDAAGKLRLTQPVDSRIKRPSADVGRDVLSQR